MRTNRSIGSANAAKADPRSFEQIILQPSFPWETHRPQLGAALLDAQITTLQAAHSGYTDRVYGRDACLGAYLNSLLAL
ncbi:hypothetical protein TWF718_005243 [Orbilia javanica]|uniref:Uncharacterized protein n=1 Tax=Orbilia javanica TaxID=47235 RepID=A0AAN8MRS0_9PEZI